MQIFSFVVSGAMTKIKIKFYLQSAKLYRHTEYNYNCCTIVIVLDNFIIVFIIFLALEVTHYIIVDI